MRKEIAEVGGRFSNVQYGIADVGDRFPDDCTGLGVDRGSFFFVNTREQQESLKA